MTNKPGKETEDLRTKNAFSVTILGTSAIYSLHTSSNYTQLTENLQGWN